MEPIAHRKSSNKEAKPLTSIGGGEVSEVLCRTGKQFHSDAPEGSQEKAGYSIYKREEHIAMLPLAMTDRNENRAGFRGAAPKHAPTFDQ